MIDLKRALGELPDGVRNIMHATKEVDMNVIADETIPTEVASNLRRTSSSSHGFISGVSKVGSQKRDHQQF